MPNDAVQREFFLFYFSWLANWPSEDPVGPLQIIHVSILHSTRRLE